MERSWYVFAALATVATGQSIELPENIIVRLGDPVTLRLRQVTATIVQWDFKSAGPNSLQFVYTSESDTMNVVGYNVDRSQPGRYDLVIDNAQFAYGGRYIATIVYNSKTTLKHSVTVSVVDRPTCGADRCSVKHAGHVQVRVTILAQSSGTRSCLRLTTTQDDVSETICELARPCDEGCTCFYVVRSNVSALPVDSQEEFARNMPEYNDSCTYTPGENSDSDDAVDMENTVSGPNSEEKNKVNDRSTPTDGHLLTLIYSKVDQIVNSLDSIRACAVISAILFAICALCHIYTSCISIRQLHSARKTSEERREIVSTEPASDSERQETSDIEQARSLTRSSAGSRVRKRGGHKQSRP